MGNWFVRHFKNIESSSESLHFAAAIKLWGKVVGDQSMEARGGLMISIMARSFNMYFYYKSDNTVEQNKFYQTKSVVYFSKIKLITLHSLEHQLIIQNMSMVSICFQLHLPHRWLERLTFKKNGKIKLLVLLIMLIVAGLVF